MKAKLRATLLLVAGLALLVPESAQAQAQTLEIKINRDWGYGGFNGEVQGNFSMIATGPGNLSEVHFQIDDEEAFVDMEPPFRFQFNTDQFDPGWRALSAFGLLDDGERIAGPVTNLLFLSAEEARQKFTGLIFPLLGVILGISALASIGPLLLGRGKKHKPYEYGAAGGAVCPKCALPFSRHIISANMLTGKMERCPHCGKWSSVPRASPEDLKAAEERLAAQAGVGAPTIQSEDDRLRKLIDESRFDN